MLKTQVRSSRDLRNHYSEIAKAVAESDHQQNIYNELQKSKASLDDPSTVLHDAEDVFERLEQRLASRAL